MELWTRNFSANLGKHPHLLRRLTGGCSIFTLQDFNVVHGGTISPSRSDDGMTQKKGPKKIASSMVWLHAVVSSPWPFKMPKGNVANQVNKTPKLFFSSLFLCFPMCFLLLLFWWFPRSAGYWTTWAYGYQPMCNTCLNVAQLKCPPHLQVPLEPRLWGLVGDKNIGSSIIDSSLSTKKHLCFIMMFFAIHSWCRFNCLFKVYII